VAGEKETKKTSRKLVLGFLSNLTSWCNIFYFFIYYLFPYFFTVYIIKIILYCLFLNKSSWEQEISFKIFTAQICCNSLLCVGCYISFVLLFLFILISYFQRPLTFMKVNATPTSLKRLSSSQSIQLTVFLCDQN